MSKLPKTTYKELIKKIRKAGFVFDRQAKGSHEIWYHPEKKVPYYNSESFKTALKRCFKSYYHPNWNDC